MIVYLRRPKTKGKSVALETTTWEYECQIGLEPDDTEKTPKALQNRHWRFRLTPAQARELAAELLDLADRADELTIKDQARRGSTLKPTAVAKVKGTP